MVDLLYGSRELFPTYNESPILSCRQNRFTRSVSYSGLNRYRILKENNSETTRRRQSIKESPGGDENDESGSAGLLGKIRQISERFTSPGKRSRNIIRFKSKLQVPETSTSYHTTRRVRNISYCSQIFFFKVGVT